MKYVIILVELIFYETLNNGSFSYINFDLPTPMSPKKTILYLVSHKLVLYYPCMFSYYNLGNYFKILDLITLKTFNQEQKKIINLKINQKL